MKSSLRIAQPKDDSSGKATARFFVRVGQAGRAAEAHVDRHTMPLFPLPVIMEAEGLLAPDARHLVRRSDPETSHVAAAQAKAFRAPHEAKVYGAIVDAAERGATAKEIARTTGLTDVQVNRRLGNMGERKLIERKYEGGKLVKRGGCAAWVKA